MKRALLFSIFFALILHLVNAQKTRLENLLFELPDVIFKEIKANKSFEKSFKIYIKQPIDHKDAAAGYFYQKAYLSHRGFDKPVVMVTEGYTCNGPHSNELSNLLQSNLLEVEHRYFGESMPDSLDYNFLNLEQATADLHHINQLFKQIYTGKWVATGISKGGVTTLFYRYFYPNDVDASVPYVAPINREFEEQRIYHFFDTIGTAKCRKDVLDFQKNILKNRKKALPFLQFYAKGARLEFTYLSLEEAFEYAVLEFPFSLWQWGYSCDEIPSTNKLFSEQLEYLMDVSGIDFFSDKAIEQYGSHYYQSAEEMGYYGYETRDFKGLLKAIPLPNPHATFIPEKIKVEFNGDLLTKVNKWLAENGNEIIYIYGGIDTWSASAVPYSDQVNAVWFMMAGQHHGSARIRNMTIEEKQLLEETLEKWLDMEITNPAPINN